jgi:hypothetical protein
MKITKIALVAAFTLAGSLAARGATPPADLPGIVPWPRQLVAAVGFLKLKPQMRIAVSDPTLLPLAKIFADDLNAAAGVKADTSAAPTDADIELRLLRDAKGEAYKLSVSDKITLSGGNYQSLAEGTVTIIQAIVNGQKSPQIARMTITDHAATFIRFRICSRLSRCAGCIRFGICICICRMISPSHFHPPPIRRWPPRGGRIRWMRCTRWFSLPMSVALRSCRKSICPPMPVRSSRPCRN